VAKIDEAIVKQF